MWHTVSLVALQVPVPVPRDLADGRLLALWCPRTDRRVINRSNRSGAFASSSREPHDSSVVHPLGLWRSARLHDAGTPSVSSGHAQFPRPRCHFINVHCYRNSRHGRVHHPPTVFCRTAASDEDGGWTGYKRSHVLVHGGDDDGKCNLWRNDCSRVRLLGYGLLLAHHRDLLGHKRCDGQRPPI